MTSDTNINFPLRFQLKGVLWPWHKDPWTHFTLGAGFEYELRAGPWQGSNQLGLLSDLSALRILASRPIWQFDVGASLGALFDPRGNFGTLEMALHWNWRMSFLDDTRIWFEGLMRGVPAVVKDPSQLVPAGLDLSQVATEIKPSGGLALGVNIRLIRGADFGLALQKNFGGLAPWVIMLRFISIDIGKGKDPPRPLWYDALHSFGGWLKERLKRVEPELKQTCVLRKGGRYIATLGATEDGEWCEFAGKRFKRDGKYYIDEENHRICLDPKYESCLTPAPEGQGSTATSWTMPGMASAAVTSPSTGTLPQAALSPNARVPGPVAHAPARRRSIPAAPPVIPPLEATTPAQSHASRATEPVDVNRLPLNNRVADAFVEGIKQGVQKHRDRLNGMIESAAELAQDPAQLTTIASDAYDSAREVAKKVAETAKDPAKAEAAAREAYDGAIAAGKEVIASAKEWWRKSPEEKARDAGERVVDLGASGIASALPSGGGKGVKGLKCVFRPS